ncbi:hypothetical protein [Ekhidna sp.]|uniref:hypothetical protein n=1 Tax=Ekhidna sp. TaxID=2608089 RepID=UPI0032EED858
MQEIEAYDEGIYFIDQNIPNSTGSTLDSLHYFKGYFNYSLKRIDQSIDAFERVRASSQTIFIRARFLTAFQHAYSRDYKMANNLVTLNIDTSSFLRELKYLELASVALLERNFTGFENYSQGFTGKYYQLANAEEGLRRNYEGLLKLKRKSPAVAGLLSGILPGLGKFYIGKTGEGYLTLLLSTIVGLQVREAYLKDGSNSTRFKIYSGIFTALYVANIWGSVVSVKIYKSEINDTYDEAILLNMHVPLRTIFD